MALSFQFRLQLRSYNRGILKELKEVKTIDQTLRTTTIWKKSVCLYMTKKDSKRELFQKRLEEDKVAQLPHPLYSLGLNPCHYFRLHSLNKIVWQETLQQQQSSFTVVSQWYKCWKRQGSVQLLYIKAKKNVLGHRWITLKEWNKGTENERYSTCFQRLQFSVVRIGNPLCD